MTKTILITGCSTGIGLTAATTLAARGHRVFATARKAADVQALQQKGFESVTLDLNDSTSIKAAVAEVLARTGGTLDALVNNAGFGQPGAVEDLTRDMMRTQFETNLFGLLELTNQVLPVMRAQGHGRIVSISSILGLVALPYRGAYNASKFALEGLMDTLRLELYKTPIHVSLIEPGPIISQFRDNVLSIFHRDIDINKSPHKANYEKIMAKTQDVKNQQPFALPPEAVVEKIVAAMESRNPKAHYYVSVPTYGLATLKRILPTRLFDWIAWRASQRDIQ